MKTGDPDSRLAKFLQFLLGILAVTLLLMGLMILFVVLPLKVVLDNPTIAMITNYSGGAFFLLYFLTLALSALHRRMGKRGIEAQARDEGVASAE